MIFEKIRERLQKLCEQTYYNSVNGNRDEGIRNNAYHNAIDIINQVEAEYNNGWIPCSERLPNFDEDVLLYMSGYEMQMGYKDIQAFGEVYVAVAKNATPIKDSIMNHFTKGE